MRNGCKENRLKFKKKPISKQYMNTIRVIKKIKKYKKNGDGLKKLTISIF